MPQFVRRLPNRGTHNRARAPASHTMATPRDLALLREALACRTGDGSRTSYGARACAPGLVREPSPCLPWPDTMTVMLNAAPTPAPASQDPRSWGPRRLPPTPPSHPAARSIEYNRHCVQPGQASCMPVPPRAESWLVRRGRSESFRLGFIRGDAAQRQRSLRSELYDTQHRGHAFGLLLFRPIARSGSAVAGVKFRSQRTFRCEGRARPRQPTAG